MQVQFACTPTPRPSVLAGVPSWIHEMADGACAHTADTLSALVKKLSEPQVGDPSLSLMNSGKCSYCQQMRLNMSQTIFRYCNYCNTYRNPMAI